MNQSFLKYIADEKLFKPDQKILLAVSGGIDSMVMLHLFHACGMNAGVAHCNFQLRGEESLKDEEFVKEQCRKLKMPFFSKRFETENHAIQHGISIQMAARDLRYEWFEEIRKKEGFDLIATAHHQNDSIETVIFNLVNGRGLEGLTGIASKNGNIIRPLLFAARKEIVDYATMHSIAWREDASNQEADYKRNFIRHKIIPLLSEINPNMEETILKSISKNKGALELQKLGISFFESTFLKKSGDKIIIHKSVIHDLQFLSPTLYYVLKSYGFSLDQTEQIVASLAGQAGKVFFSRNYELVVDRKDLIITPLKKGNFSLQIEQHTSVIRHGHITLQMETITDFSFDDHSILLDADQIKFPLIWRNWREGDFFYPLGMNHKKKLSDFLIDQKIPRSDKSEVTVLESAGEIIWVVGHRISEHFKITSATTHALKFTFQSHFI